MNYIIPLFLAACSLASSQNSSNYWQQHVNYKINVEVDLTNWQYQGTEKLVYTNNSPDTLTQVFYHMYPNAFQPGSEMDIRSRTIADPDRRVGSRIALLKPDEQGFLKTTSLTQDGEPIYYDLEGTVLVVDLARSIAPMDSTILEMGFHGQIPIQIRRSGRNNSEGVALSMTQWYPKLAEYDTDGWHTDPYIAREFYGVWGDFNVSIDIDSHYIVGGTGYLTEKKTLNNGRSRWMFNAPNVHDFSWAADPDYIHDTYLGPNGVTLNFYYKNTPELTENWRALQPITSKLLAYFNKAIGPYPYNQYSVIQGGDGGMEYAMCTLITGERSFESLVGVTAHEMAHTWFQFLLATNESLHEWMDEGFTTYISSLAEDQVLNQESPDPLYGAYRAYNYLANSGLEQPMSTHADRYNTNQNYGVAAYSKGAVFLAQLGYIMGERVLEQTIKTYYDNWKFKHPKPQNFIRTAERASGLNLDWYLQDFATTTNTIDYRIVSVDRENNTQNILLERVGLMPMPIELLVTYDDGNTQMFYIPLQMMRGEKSFDRPVQVLKDWTWAAPTYRVAVKNKKNISKIEIDPSGRMADINRKDNLLEQTP